VNEPRSLYALLQWYRGLISDRIPSSLHSRDLDDGGGPAFSGAFKSYLYAPPYGVDDEGHVLDPLKHCLWRMRKSGGKDARRAAFLYALARADFDPFLAVKASHDTSRYIKDMADDYARASLAILYRNFQLDPVVEDRVKPADKSEAQINAETAAPVST